MTRSGVVSTPAVTRFWMDEDGTHWRFPEECSAPAVGGPCTGVSEIERLRVALAASEAEVKRLGVWVANRKERDKRGYQKWRAAHPDEHRRLSRESMARTRARRKAIGA